MRGPCLRGRHAHLPHHTRVHHLNREHTHRSTQHNIGTRFSCCIAMYGTRAMRCLSDQSCSASQLHHRLVLHDDPIRGAVTQESRSERKARLPHDACTETREHALTLAMRQTLISTGVHEREGGSAPPVESKPAGATSSSHHGLCVRGPANRETRWCSFSVTFRPPSRSASTCSSPSLHSDGTGSIRLGCSCTTTARSWVVAAVVSHAPHIRSSCRVSRIAPRTALACPKSPVCLAEPPASDVVRTKQPSRQGHELARTGSSHGATRQKMGGVVT